MAHFIKTHSLGLDLQTGLLGHTEKAWRCFNQASGENRAKLKYLISRDNQLTGGKKERPPKHMDNHN